MSFKEIFGQDTAVSLLKAAFRKNRVAHAYLCIGPDGVGKRKTVLNFIKLLLCGNGTQTEACDVCPNCAKIEARNHADIHWVERDGQFIRIDAVKEACRQLNLKGFESSRKFLIVRQAQYLNEESSNALLKTLEEPSLDTVIFLLVNSAKSVLPTIVSRCQRVIFSSLSEGVLVKLLNERFSIKPQQALYLARISQGSLGQALQYYESGLFERKDEIIKNVLNKDYPSEKLIDAASSDKDHYLEEMLCVLSSWFRDMLLAKASLPDNVFINADRKDDIMQASRSFSFEDIDKRIASIAETTMEKGRNINMRLSLAKLRIELWK